MKASHTQQMSILRWSLILLAIIIAPAWAQNKKGESKPAPAQHSAPAPQQHSAPAQHSAPPAQHQPGGGGGARPAAGGRRRRAAGWWRRGIEGEGGWTGKSAADTYKPAAGYGNAERE